jgi:hypothetical protein
MATYPSDATANTGEFAVLSTVSFNSTGATTDFNLGADVTRESEVIASVDGAVQDTTSYAITNSGATVSFVTAPNASTLSLKTISLPQRFQITRKIELTGAVVYSNSSARVVEGNAYLINGHQESFALPVSANVTDANTMMVFLSGVLQAPQAFTFPSVALGNKGIDIGDNTTKLLLNFEGSNATDESEIGQTDLNSTSKTYSSTAAFGSKSVDLNGSSHFLDYGSKAIFDINQSDFTFEAFVNPDSLSANGTIFSRYQDADDYFVIRTVGANNTIGYVSDVQGSIHELYGGTINTGSFYHVAFCVSRDDETASLYVNNVRVAVSQKVFGNTLSGNVNIGRFNTGEFFNGKVDAVRFARAAKYKGTGAQPMTLAPTVLGGGALGALDSQDTLDIRVYQGTSDKDDRFVSMSDRKPDVGFSTTRAFDSAIFQSQAGYEKRRLRSRRSKRSYDLKYTNLHGIGKRAIDEFYTARSGEFESFTFDLGHINESGTATVRFDGALNVTQVLGASSNLRDNFYTVTFKLQETFD